jgi:Nucleotidyl transferase AbiEii toxin, Type IV TA system
VTRRDGSSPGPDRAGEPARVHPPPGRPRPSRPTSSVVLVGGLAVSARTEPRFTRDIDLVIAVAGDRDAEGLVHDLQGRNYRAQTILEQEAIARLASARLVPVAEDETGTVLDVLFASSGIEPEIVVAAEPLEILPHLRVPVATIGQLIALKLLARDDRLRPQDRVDLNAPESIGGARPGAGADRDRADPRPRIPSRPGPRDGVRASDAGRPVMKIGLAPRSRESTPPTGARRGGDSPPAGWPCRWSPS